MFWTPVVRAIIIWGTEIKVSGIGNDRAADQPLLLPCL